MGPRGPFSSPISSLIGLERGLLLLEQSSAVPTVNQVQRTEHPPVNAKATANRLVLNQMQATIRYGVDSVTKTYAEAPTFSEFIEDTKEILGAGDNVKPLIHGVEQNLEATVPAGASVLLETKANGKGD